LVYHSVTRAWEITTRHNPEESIMSSESSTAAVATDRNHENADTATRKRARPLTTGQEALFFGVTFAVAVVFQLAVILKVANVIAW
jgi:hypothetical protein